MIFYRPGDPTMLVAMTKEEKKRRLSMRVTNMLVPEVHKFKISIVYCIFRN